MHDGVCTAAPVQAYLNTLCIMQGQMHTKSDCEVSDLCTISISSAAVYGCRGVGVLLHDGADVAFLENLVTHRSRPQVTRFDVHCSIRLAGSGYQNGVVNHVTAVHLVHHSLVTLTPDQNLLPSY